MHISKEKIKEDNRNIKISIKNISKEEDNESFDVNSTKKFVDIIRSIPNGVYHKDKYNNPLVSLNIGRIEVEENKIRLSFSIRSNRIEIEEKLEEKLEKIVNKYKIQLKVNELSGYEHKQKSEFIETCKEIYTDYFKRKPRIIDMHICLEAGFFGEKIPNFDFIAIAPNIYDAHSPKERCSISSLTRIYNYILLILRYLR